MLKLSVGYPFPSDGELEDIKSIEVTFEHIKGSIHLLLDSNHVGGFGYGEAMGKLALNEGVVEFSGIAFDRTGRIMIFDDSPEYLTVDEKQVTRYPHYDFEDDLPHIIEENETWETVSALVVLAWKKAMESPSHEAVQIQWNRYLDFQEKYRGRKARADISASARFETEKAKFVLN